MFALFTGSICERREKNLLAVFPKIFRRAQKELAEIEAERDSLLSELKKTTLALSSAHDAAGMGSSLAANSISAGKNDDIDEDMYESLKFRLNESQHTKNLLQQEVQRLQQEVREIFF